MSCPFGGNTTPYGKEKHPVHGETANSNWTLRSIKQDDAGTEASLTLNTRIRRGRVEKIVRIPDDHDAVYQRHIVSGMSGPMSFGHHAMGRT